MDDLNVSCDYVTVEPESNPDSLHQWLSVVENGTRRSDVATKAKKHLSSLGWRFAYFPKGNKRRELRYKSPKGKWFYSLATACSSCVHENDDGSRNLSLALIETVAETAAFSGTKSILSVDKKKRKLVNNGETTAFNVSTKRKRKRVKDCETAAFDGTIAFLDVDESKKRKLVNNGETTAFSGTKVLVNVDVLKKKRKLVNNGETAAFNGSKELLNVDVLKKRKLVNDGETTAFNGTKAILSVDVLRKRVNDCETAAFNGVTLNKTLVLKKRKRVNDSKTTPFNGGASTEEKNGLSDLTKVILNVDATKAELRPRYEKSLRKVLQVMEKKNAKCEKESIRFWRKDCGPEKNCDVCCVCHYGGDLLLCDGCPSSFHHTCIGLSMLPEEELWFCPCCCCDICGSMVTLGNSKLMSCEQCQRRFHLKCLKQEEACLVSCQGWFCSRQCSGVYTALESLLGCKIAVGEEGLVWSLIRAPNDDEHYDDEQMAKLDSAVEILHQGFEPSTDPFSGRDLVEELIFRKDPTGVGRGFYTVLVERNNELVTVATMRVDKDVAEIPLVATLFNYRRSGMCRVLMDELEKQMSRMGVRRLVLPAAKEVVSTWSQGFGFRVMESWERLEFVKHGMLDFVGTVMCHKFLRGREVSGESSLTE